MPPHRYTSLDSELLVKQFRKLAVRIEERFPESGLYRVALQLTEVSADAAHRIEVINEPIWSLRAAVGVIVLIIIAVPVVTLSAVPLEVAGITLLDAIQILETGINDLILLGAALIFLISLERRIKRNRTLKALHELRSIAHVIDMHQLTKDPARLRKHWVGTPNSPVLNLTPWQLSRYFDYCSELLSLVGKLAALHAQHFDDEVLLASVNQLENLTTTLCSQIWQKSMILHGTVLEDEDNLAALSAPSNTQITD